MMDQSTAQTPGSNAVLQPEQPQLQQIRQNALSQIANLKQQIAVIQQQSLKAMQDSVDVLLKNLSADNVQQLSAQDQQVLNQVSSPVANSNQAAVGTTGNYPAAIPTGSTLSFDAGRQAMEAAGKSVEQAMQSATMSVKNAEQAITSTNG